jgi:hypothetical protein
MNKEQVFVIVGASLAGAKAGEALRSEGFDGRVLIGEEPHRPYERPPLSKDYLRGEAEADKLYVHGEGFYTEHDIELRTGSPVTTIDRASGIVIDATGERTRYDRLLVATGAAARRLRFPGAELGGIFYLRYRADADRLRRALATATRVAVVGGGWIGAEVAASVRQMGREVTMIHSDTAPLRASSAPRRLRRPQCPRRTIDEDVDHARSVLDRLRRSASTWPTSAPPSSTKEWAASPPAWTACWRRSRPSGRSSLADERVPSSAQCGATSSRRRASRDAAARSCRSRSLACPPGTARPI